MKRNLIAFILSLIASTTITLTLAAQPSRTSAETQIRAVLDAQVDAWNRGDVDTFMQSYWKSDKTEFVGSTGIFKGWEAVLERYRKSYPDRRSMGTVKFSGLEITVLSSSAALVVGHYQLDREVDHPGGVFTLVFRKFSEGWKIINDHTSVVPKQ